jgi:hypothetical protein
MQYKDLIIFFFAVVLTIYIIPNALAENSCLDCHEKLSAFNETEQQFNEIRIKHLVRDVACSVECHVDTLEKFAKNNYEQWTNSRHALFNVTCDNCHGGDPDQDIKEKAHTGIKRSSDPDSTVFYRNVPETCGECHSEELKQFMNSLHYQRLKALKQAPTCDTCHSPHEFRVVINKTELYDLCRTCHNTVMRIAPDVPETAVTTVESAEKLKNEIIAAQNAIKQAVQSGKDISTAQKNLDTALSIQDQLPVLWHDFNLENFENIIEDGIRYAQQATLDTGIPVSTPKTPGPGIIAALIGIVAIYLLRRR